MSAIENAQNLKVGDRVWVGRRCFPRSEGIRVVVRLTASLIILEPDNDFSRFSRHNGFQKGGARESFISGLATPEECAQAEAEATLRAKAADDRKKREEETARLSAEASNLFKGVGDSARRGPGGGYSVQLEFLSLDEVGMIAQLINERKGIRGEEVVLIRAYVRERVSSSQPLATGLMRRVLSYRHLRFGRNDDGSEFEFTVSASQSQEFLDALHENPAVSYANLIPKPVVMVQSVAEEVEA